MIVFSCQTALPSPTLSDVATYAIQLRKLLPPHVTHRRLVPGAGEIMRAAGLLRRLEFDADGFTDEGLRQDFSWDFTPLIVEWERGNFRYDLVEVSHERASKIIEHFRQKWEPSGRAAGL
jgi:hypothetical protein